MNRTIVRTPYGSLWGLFSDDSPSPLGPSGTTNPFGTQAERAWAAGFVGSSDVFIGIIDGGLQVDHLQLSRPGIQRRGQLRLLSSVSVKTR